MISIGSMLDAKAIDIPFLVSLMFLCLQDKYASYVYNYYNITNEK